MKKIYTVLIVVFAFVFITNVQAQEKSISGTVTSKLDGTTLPGVSIVVQGTARGTETDFDGNQSGGTIDTDIQIRRIPFVDSEKSTNAAGVTTATSLLSGPDNGGTRLWWDTGASNF